MTEHTVAAKRGDKFTLNGVQRVVGARGADDSGCWVCTTHGISFPNNLSKDGHVSEGKHTLAWNCYTHGPEVP